MADGTLMSGAADLLEPKTFIWTAVIHVYNDGATAPTTGEGPIQFNDVVPSGAIATQILSQFAKQLTQGYKNINN